MTRWIVPQVWLCRLSVRYCMQGRIRGMGGRKEGGREEGREKEGGRTIWAMFLLVRNFL